VLQVVNLVPLGLGALLSRPIVVLPTSLPAAGTRGWHGHDSATHSQNAQGPATHSQSPIYPQPGLAPALLGAFGSADNCTLAAIDAAQPRVLWRWERGCPTGQMGFARGAMIFGRPAHSGGGVVALGWDGA